MDLLGHSNEKDGMLDSSRVLATAKTVGLDALVLVGGTATLRAALDVGKAALTAGSGCRILAVPVRAFYLRFMWHITLVQLDSIA